MIVNEDILKWCEEYTEKFHAVLCDPPYHLTSMARPREDLDDYDNGKGNPFARRQAAMKGFMGKEWDGGDISFDPKTWRAISRHLYPGAYLLAFGGTRTFHRIAVAIEDAGFEIRDTVMWVYGSGFPKSHNISKAIDRENGDERPVIGEHPNPAKSIYTQGEDELPESVPLTSAASAAWEGYGTALKPSWEPIIIARKPLEGTVAQNALKYGSGALNIDGSRVGTEEVETGRGGRSGGSTFNASIGDKQKPHIGRWPANLIHDGSDEVVGMFPGEDDKSAARFFYSAKVSKRERDAGLEGFEEKDGGALEGNADMDNDRKIGANPERKVAPVRNNHPTLKPISLTTYLAKLILPPKLDKPRRLLVPFAGSGSEVIGGYLAGWDEVLGVEREKEYAEIAEARIKHWTSSSPQSSSSSTSAPPESTDGQEILDI